MSPFRYHEIPPAPDLAWAVECFWFAEGDGGGSERIVPDGCPELVVQLGDEMLAGDDAEPLRAQPRALLVGQRSRALLVSPRGPFCTVAVRLRPGALGAVVRDHAGALTHRWASLEELFGAKARLLVDQLGHHPDDGGRMATLERFVRARLAGARTIERLDRALAAIRSTRGRISVRALRVAADASERWLERTFLREVGLAPRTLSAVLRVQSALLRRESLPSWASLAAELGYFDQPHLTREFKRYAGLPPAALLEALGPLARAFSEPERLRTLLDVGSMQDGPRAVTAG